MRFFTAPISAVRSSQTRPIHRLPSLIGLFLLFFLSPCFAFAADAASQFHNDVQPILKQVCYDCHGGGKKKGGFQIDQFKNDADMLAARDLWTKALRYVRAGVMPPPGEDQPADSQKQQLANWIKYGVYGIKPNDVDPGRI